ncbi:YceD family protein [Bosea sp. NPDC055332]
MTVSDQDKLPLRRPIRVESITLRPVAVEIVPEQGDLAAIATFLGVASVEALKVSYSLSRNGERVKLEGMIKAGLHQNCVVTLEAFPVELNVPVKLDFVPEEEIAAMAQPSEDDEIDIEVLLNEEEQPEAIVDGAIDLGAVTLEFLALSLDPYPRKPGVEFSEPAPETPAESPFAALLQLKRGQ